jgi:hypothetical protein
MAIYNVLSWRNENSLTGHPFQNESPIPGFIVDARFVQFDGFIPLLKSVRVEDDSVFLDILFDLPKSIEVVFTKNWFNLGEKGRHIYIHYSTPTYRRYMGSISFGEGTSELWPGYVGRKLNFGLQFLPETVRSIPSKDAVYTFDGDYGDVTIGRANNDSSIFFNKTPNAIVHNAVGGHSVENTVPQGLRQINLVKPRNNNINLASNDIIKMSSPTNTTLVISLVGGSTSGRSFAAPTLSS